MEYWNFFSLCDITKGTNSSVLGAVVLSILQDHLSATICLPLTLAHTDEMGCGWWGSNQSPALAGSCEQRAKPAALEDL